MYLALIEVASRTLEDHKILGFPVKIDDNKYARNAFRFNLCFVCNSDTRTVQYEHVVTKFSEYLMAMEIESGFLSSGNSSGKLTPILKRVLADLNTRGIIYPIIKLGKGRKFMKNYIIFFNFNDKVGILCKCEIGLKLTVELTI